MDQAERMSAGTAATPDEMLATAIAAVGQGEVATRDALDQLPAPIYTTDAQGRITYFNKACVDFAGRTPKLGRDSWCVTWKLYTEDGEFLPHDRCPMAVAIKQKKAIRGSAAIAERPDGSRVNFVPYPTPVLDEQGEMIGAVNLLIDVTARKKSLFLRDQALRCRRLAQSINDSQTVNTLKLMAAEYDEQASALSPGELTHR
jgi:PAS domain S-box-containing protein